MLEPYPKPRVASTDDVLTLTDGGPAFHLSMMKGHCSQTSALMAQNPPHADPHHDHTACIRSAMDSAERLCRERGVRLTPLRKRVLKQIWQSHEAVKAYELIHQLSSHDHTVKPPTVYRALDFLLAQGLVHRIESLNGYVGCIQPEQAHDTLLLICRQCGVVTELADAGVTQALREKASSQGFALDQPIVEGRGLCRQCAEQRGTQGDGAGEG
ncbi:MULTISPECIES: transcriptional repressor [Ectothiorhodospira]|uniref:transcriptional repressor n=1 Tax=Ectothiorhodospira TaxID=1051 RepID=UPI0030840F3A